MKNVKEMISLDGDDMLGGGVGIVIRAPGWDSIRLG